VEIKTLYVRGNHRRGREKMKKHLGTIGLLSIAIVWGTGFVASSVALRGLSPSEFMFLRFLIAAVLMTIISFKKIIKASKKTILAGISLGIWLYLAFILQTVGLANTTPSKNAFLTAVNVIIVPFIAFLVLKIKVDKYSIIGAVLAVVGIGVLSLNIDFTLSFGDWLTLLCAVCFAIHIFLTGQSVKKHDMFTLVTLQMITAFLLSFFVLLFTEGIQIQLGRNETISVLYSGIMCTTVAFFIQAFSQRYTTETQAAVILSTESLFGTIFSVLIIGEVITGRMVMGCILIMTAVLISETKLGIKQS